MGSGSGLKKYNPIEVIKKDPGLAIFPDPIRGTVGQDLFGGKVKAGVPDANPQMATPDQSRAYYLENLKNDARLDEGTRASLIAQANEASTEEGFRALQERMNQVMNPESEEGKKRVQALERAKLQKDMPGLQAQTSFLAGGNSSSGGYLGGR